MYLRGADVEGLTCATMCWRRANRVIGRVAAGMLPFREGISEMHVQMNPVREWAACRIRYSGPVLANPHNWNKCNGM